MTTVHRSSGDLIADRRYVYAQAALGDGDIQAAADLADQTLELVPRFAPAWFLLGRAREALHRSTGAADAFHAALRAYGTALDLDPEDALGARLQLARLGDGDPLAALSPGYVRALFDAYAARFDRHLSEDLAYLGPELIAEALRSITAAQGRSFRFERVLDLGCGTGLMARALADAGASIAGVDLSPAMLAQAERTGLYDRLVEGDLAAFLGAEPSGSADLVTAADVFVYLGRLDGVLADIRRVLAPGGLLGFTVQAHDGSGIALGDDARYAHGEPYLRQSAGTAGLAVLTLEPASSRLDRDMPVPGFRVVLARPS